MLFNSYVFIFIFLPLSFLLYFIILENLSVAYSKAFLVFVSLFFYGWWNVIYLPLIVISMAFNFFIGSKLNARNVGGAVNKKLLLLFGIIANLSLLAYFKYVDFFIENFNNFSGYAVSPLELALPLAISFFTFQQIAYLVDSYREETRQYTLLSYALFVTFFPQLIAGPIVHHKEMMPQFASSSNHIKNYKNILAGLFVFSIGLFKKVVIADTFAIWATNGFDKTEILNVVEAWITSLSYTLQLYFDFSGYTDMAIGIALLFNIKLPVNFNSPYKAKNIQDFWRRWHITLSRFLRDYIYIPLGGDRYGSFRTYSNLMITFILGGFWHGAGWTFIFWGGLHGIALAVHRVWKGFDLKMWNWMGWFLTFNFVNIAWVFFRAEEWSDAMKVIKGMFGANEFGGLNDLLIFSNLQLIDLCLMLFLFLTVPFILASKNSLELSVEIGKNKVYFSAMLLLTSIMFFNKTSSFLYFNF